jgi:hypothetical protein
MNDLVTGVFECIVRDRRHSNSTTVSNSQYKKMIRIADKHMKSPDHTVEVNHYQLDNAVIETKITITNNRVNQ